MLRRHPLAILALAALLSSPGVALAGSGGPDGYGYTWRDINDVAGCPVQSDIFQLPNNGSFALSNVIGPIDLGFSFPFYDRIVSQVWFHQAGLVCFQAPPTSNLWTNQDIPRAGDGVAGFIAPYWSFSAHANPSVYWQSFPTDGYFKASFDYLYTENGGQPLQFEVYLYKSGDIRMEYIRPSNSPLVTIGMEGFSETAAHSLKMRYNATQLGGMTYGTPTPFAICITRPRFMNCASSTPITCGTPVNGTSPASVVTNVQNWGCGAGTWAGKERIYEIDVTSLSDLNVSLTGTGTRTMAAYLLRSCNEFECVSGGSGSFLATNVQPGRYYVAVDAAAARDEGAFTLTVTCTPLSEPISCGETLSDTTVGQRDRLNGYSCLAGDFSGAEQYYTVNFTPPGNLNVSLDTTTGQAVFIMNAADPFAASSCIVGGVGGAILFSPDPGTYLIVVDGPAGGDGAYTISLNCDPVLSCGAAPAATCQQRVTGSTRGLTPRADFYRCSTQLYDGPEEVYVFTQTTTSTVSFILETATPELDIILLGSCNEGDCIEIGDDTISKELAPGTYYLVVDGRNGAYDQYTLTTICGFGLEPASLSVTGAAGECFTEVKQAWLTPELVQADIFFMIDLTGSMSGVRSQLQANMNDIIDRVQAFIQDVAFGLSSYKDYSGTFATPAPCSYNQNYGAGDYPYQLHQPITTNRTQIESAVAALPPASGGGDGPESYSRALYEAVQDPGIGWRTNSRRLVVNFGDEMPHDCNVLECLGGTGFVRGLDPGRDNTIGTADDLRILDVVQQLVDNDMVLLHLTNSFGSDGGFTYTDIWDCWARRTGGQGEQLNANGTVPGGIDLAELVAELIRAQGSFCRELRLEAERGWEGWVSSVTPVLTDVQLPTFVEFDITFCVPPGTPPGPYDFVVNLMCGDQIVTSQRVHVDVTIDCSASVVSPPASRTICEGDTTTLDASGMSVVNCSGSAVYEWRDGAGVLVGTGATLDVSPANTTDYTVTVSCSTDPTCEARAPLTVTVEKRPVVANGTLVDPRSCNLGLELAWDAVTFPSGTGYYNVYRSEISCADALTRPPINPPNLRDNAYIDPTTRSGRTYYYAVVAEDAAVAVSCRPPGPNNGGVVSAGSICLGPVTEVDDPGFPDYLGWSLRVSHQGQQVTLDWTGARALQPGEHFHVTKGTDPRVLTHVNGEGQVSLTHVETDTSSTLQFFDVRIANSCEEVSLDDEPEGWDAGR